jgi:hypothetical protein
MSLGSQKQQWADSITSGSVTTGPYWITAEPSQLNYVVNLNTGPTANITTAGWLQNSSANSSRTVVTTISNVSAKLWSVRVDGSYNINSYLLGGLASETSGNVFASGIFYANSTNDYGHVSKFDSNGNFLWGKNFKDTTGAGKTVFDSTFNNIGFSSSGNLIVAGYTNWNPSFPSITNVALLARINPSTGALIWSKNIDNGTASGGTNYFDGLAFDSVDNIYVRSTMGSNGILKFDSGGNLQWQNYGWSNSGGPDGASTSYIWTFGVDKSDRVWIGAQETFSGTSGCMLLVQTDSSGTINWANKYWHPGYDRIQPQAMTFDVDDNAYVLADIYVNNSQSTSFDMVIVKLNSAGSIIWSKLIYNASATVNDIPASIGINSEGHLIVTGWSNPSSTGLVMSFPRDGSDSGTYTITSDVTITYANTTAFTSNTSNAAFKSYSVGPVTSTGVLTTQSPNWVPAYPYLVTKYLPGS